MLDLDTILTTRQCRPPASVPAMKSDRLTHCRLTQRTIHGAPDNLRLLPFPPSIKIPRNWHERDGLAG
ncbi:hypothetical protein Hypma_011182 [Hypsizygus marmoreus]|uniref:Uncharacterized protein n=1 Tax=Hypsizygus marmoreus TaxID=39966 RepID=A0A369JQP4_HYPMA|nr:hypothetical protein Hypma_011182 [Hypsizygus marmoreus]